MPLLRARRGGLRQPLGLLGHAGVAGPAKVAGQRPVTLRGQVTQLGEAQLAAAIEGAVIQVDHARVVAGVILAARVAAGLEGAEDALVVVDADAVQVARGAGGCQAVDVAVVIPNVVQPKAPSAPVGASAPEMTMVPGLLALIWLYDWRSRSV